MMDRILSRERECFDLLRELKLDRAYVLIGGFAVSAYGFPRLSVDLDIAIPEKELGSIKELMKERGFNRTEESSDFDQVYGGRFERYVKGEDLPVSVDLLINSVQARQTNYPYSFRYLFRNSEVREIRGWHPSVRAETRVPDRGMLISLKINSMRTVDKRDIIMLCYESPDVDRIMFHIKNCPRRIIRGHLHELSEVLMDPHKEDSIKGVFSVSEKVLRKAVGNCRKVTAELEGRLGESE